MEYLLIFISAIFVNNIVLSQFLGICPFLGVSQKISTSLGMGAAVAFVLTLSTIVTYLVQIYILNPMGLQYLQTIAFILVIAALVQMVEIILKKVSPSLYQALGIYLPLITTNCAVLGVAILVIQKDFSLIQSVVYAFSTAVGFAVALIDELLGFFGLGVGTNVGGHFLHVGEIGERGELDGVSDNGEGEGGVVVAGGDPEAGFEAEAEGVGVAGADFIRGGGGENGLVAGGGDAGVIRIGAGGVGAKIISVGVDGKVFEGA